MESEQKVQTPAKEKGVAFRPEPQGVPKANRNVKDSVFRNIFSDKRYLLQLYQTLHPEDDDCTEEDLACVTLEQILVRDIHNDLGFMVRDKSLIMLEAQSSWTVNIIVRALMYIIRTYQDYFRESAQSLFTTKAVHMPEPEIYVVYSGNEKIEREWITLSGEFFGGKQTALEVRVKVLTGGCGNDIVSQYISFTKVVNGQFCTLGRTRKAIAEAIQICRERNILREYLESRQKEVEDIMFTLFDQEEILKDFIASERREQAEETAREVTKEVTRETARALYENKVAIEIIAKSLKQNVRTIESWLGLAPQM
ncbi:MAG: hypothetical protein LUH19_06055 [Lachnospiraceae bacterium]|nr:hypothetical protein [Lachnospiraceae bacterium]